MIQSELQQLLVKYVLEERVRQDAKFGQMPRHMTPDAWLVVINAEIGEVSKAIIKYEPNNYIVELIQVAAVCLAAIEDYVQGESILPLTDILEHPIKYGFNIETIFDEEPEFNFAEYASRLTHEELRELDKETEGRQTG